MDIVNVHERTFLVGPDEIERLLGSLAGVNDAVWPRRWWPAMKLAPGLAVDARGGHGPIAYAVESLDPRRVVFRFSRMRGLGRGLVGHHAFEIRIEANGVVVRHVIEARAIGWMRVKWPLLIRPLHDALIEDALDNIGAAVGAPSTRPARWSLWVRVLRNLLGAPTTKQAAFDEDAVRFQRLLGGVDNG